MLVASARADEPRPGATDLTQSSPDSIEAKDIIQALAVPRGTVVERVNPPRVLLPIFFDFDSATLAHSAERMLDEIGIALASSDLDGFDFAIEGHTDNLGSGPYNDSLSRERAATVKRFLAAAGVCSDRLQTTGRGESSPIASNASASGRQRNRRVELVNLGLRTR